MFNGEKITGIEDVLNNYLSFLNNEIYKPNETVTRNCLGRIE